MRKWMLGVAGAAIAIGASMTEAAAQAQTAQPLALQRIFGR